MAAALLARHDGKPVLVMERHYVAGGYTHTFHRPGYDWDVGVHYIGQAQNPDSPLQSIGTSAFTLHPLPFASISSTAFSNTSKDSRSASSAMVRGGAIFRHSPQAATGANISTPL